MEASNLANNRLPPSDVLILAKIITLKRGPHGFTSSFKSMPPRGDIGNTIM